MNPPESWLVRFTVSRLAQFALSHRIGAMPLLDSPTGDGCGAMATMPGRYCPFGIANCETYAP
jgi:hypothetical protein